MSKHHTCRVCGKKWRCNGFSTCKFRLEAMKTNMRTYGSKDIQDNCTCSDCHKPMDWECSDRKLAPVKVEFT